MDEPVLPPSTFTPLKKEDFTWTDSIMLLPISILFVLPLSFFNALSHPGGYQKLIPQLLIPEEKRLSVKCNIVESLFV
jgi:hypothetical protein